MRWRTTILGCYTGRARHRGDKRTNSLEPRPHNWHWNIQFIDGGFHLCIFQFCKKNKSFLHCLAMNCNFYAWDKLMIWNWVSNKVLIGQYEIFSYVEWDFQFQRNVGKSFWGWFAFGIFQVNSIIETINSILFLINIKYLFLFSSLQVPLFANLIVMTYEIQLVLNAIQTIFILLYFIIFIIHRILFFSFRVEFQSQLHFRCHQIQILTNLCEIHYSYFLWLVRFCPFANV